MTARIVSAQSGTAYGDGLVLDYGNGESFVSVSTIKVWGKCESVESCRYFEKLRSVELTVRNGMFEAPNLICVECLSQLYMDMTDLPNIVYALNIAAKKEAV